jgi:hypothetical protein
LAHRQDIDRAITAHGLWKQRLAAAISSGSGDFTVAQVQADDRCEFGKWLQDLVPDLRDSEKGRSVRDMHAAFHAEAGRILGLALASRVADATAALAPGGRYSMLTGRLTVALMQWKAVL